MEKNNCSLGGDTRNGCEGCVYSEDYHHDEETGECVRND